MNDKKKDKKTEESTEKKSRAVEVDYSAIKAESVSIPIPGCKDTLTRDVFVVPSTSQRFSTLTAAKREWKKHRVALHKKKKEDARIADDIERITKRLETARDDLDSIATVYFAKLKRESNVDDRHFIGQTRERLQQVIKTISSWISVDR